MNDLKGKKITVMGLGLLGRAVGDVRFLAESGAELIVTDLKSREALAPSLDALRDIPNVTYVLGGHRKEDFNGRDLILRSADVRPDSPYLAEARSHGIPVKMSTSLFASRTSAMVVGITGTRGKSTTTHLLFDILSLALRGSTRQVFLGGNIRGVSTLPLLKETKIDDIVVLELDSWQLQGFGEEKISPHLAIFTTFLPDHQNYYRHDMEAYFNDKANIFRFQTSQDILIVGSQVIPFLDKYRHEVHAQMTVPQMLDDSWEIKIPGAHNRANASLAVEAARALDVPDEISRTVVAEFAGVPGRLEKIREINGVSFYNDTTATTPDAACAGLDALGGKKNIILIMGGADKELDMSRMLVTIPRDCRKIIILPGTGTDRIRKELNELAVDRSFVSSMHEAVTEAANSAVPGDIVLMSPGFASFGLFQNEFHRGDEYVREVKDLA